MAIKKFKPTSPGQRFKSVADFSQLTKKRPEKRLTEPNPKKAGRNNLGRITMRRRGGGHKRLYRLVDFRRDKDGVPGTVRTLEYAARSFSFSARTVGFQQSTGPVPDRARQRLQ